MGENSLSVVSQDTELFLDKVIAHAAQNSLLTRERREFLRTHLAVAANTVAGLLGWNILDIGDSLASSQIAWDLLSVKLERDCLGDVYQATNILNEYNPNNLVEEILTELRRDAAKIRNFALQCKVGVTDFGYNVELIPSRFHTRPEEEWLNMGSVGHINEWSLPVYEKLCLPRILKAIHTLKDYRQWKAVLADFLLEVEASAVFLPWEQLKRESGFRAVPRLGNPPQVFWSAETLMITMAATFVSGGSPFMVGRNIRNDPQRGIYLQMGTIYPKNLLNHLAHTIEDNKSFAKVARNSFQDYLDTSHQLSRRPSPEETTKLLEMWDAAIGQLLKEVAGLRGKKEAFTFWMERIHLDVRAGALQAVVLEGKKYRRQQPATTRSQRLIEALENGKHGSAINRLLQGFNWTDALEEGRASRIIALLPASLILATLPLLPELFNLVCQYWQTPGGQRDWNIQDRQTLARKALQGGSNEFWRRLSNHAVDAIVAVLPEQKEHILSRLRPKT